MAWIKLILLKRHMIKNSSLAKLMMSQKDLKAIKSDITSNPIETIMTLTKVQDYNKSMNEETKQGKS